MGVIPGPCAGFVRGTLGQAVCPQKKQPSGYRDILKNYFKIYPLDPQGRRDPGSRDQLRLPDKHLVPSYSSLKYVLGLRLFQPLGCVASGTGAHSCFPEKQAQCLTLPVRLEGIISCPLPWFASVSTRYVACLYSARHTQLVEAPQT